MQVRRTTGSGQCTKGGEAQSMNRMEKGVQMGLGIGFTYREDCDGSGREYRHWQWQVLFLLL